MGDLSLFSVAVVLFLIMDSIGNIASYLQLMEGIPPKRRILVLLREMGIVLIAMLLFNYLGEFIFELLGISETTVRIASGVILFIIAVKILFPSIDSLRANLPKGEPFVSPLAIPLTAGPSLLATVMLYAHMEPSQPLMLAAILLSTAATFCVFLAAPFLQRVLGSNVLLALEKILGMILVLMAVQRFTEGLKQFLVAHGY